MAINRQFFLMRQKNLIAKQSVSKINWASRLRPPDLKELPHLPQCSYSNGMNECLTTPQHKNKSDSGCQTNGNNIKS